MSAAPEIPESAERAAADFTCPVHSCKLTGRACAMRWRASKAAALEAEPTMDVRCAECPAGEARARFLQISLEDYTHRAANRPSPSRRRDPLLQPPPMTPVVSPRGDPLPEPKPTPRRTRRRKASTLAGYPAPGAECLREGCSREPTDTRTPSHPRRGFCRQCWDRTLSRQRKKGCKANGDRAREWLLKNPRPAEFGQCATQGCLSRTHSHTRTPKELRPYCTGCRDAARAVIDKTREGETLLVGRTREEAMVAWLEAKPQRDAMRAAGVRPTPAAPPVRPAAPPAQVAAPVLQQPTAREAELDTRLSILWQAIDEVVPERAGEIRRLADFSLRVVKAEAARSLSTITPTESRS